MKVVIPPFEGISNKVIVKADFVEKTLEICLNFERLLIEILWKTRRE